MTRSFTKLFSSLPESTVWGEPYATRIAWITMLATADRDGCVWGSVPGLARRAAITLEECKIALTAFQSPDAYSRTSDHEGRRVEVIDGGWRLLNYEKYREMRDADAKREADAARQRRHRASKLSEEHRLDESRSPPDSAQPNAEGVTKRDKCDSHAVSQEVAQAEAEADKRYTRNARSVLEDAFAQFWEAYPRKVAKQAAGKAWHKLKPDNALVAEMLAALAVQSKSERWQKDGGEYVPNPASWINGQRWEDCTAPGSVKGGHNSITVMSSFE